MKKFIFIAIILAFLSCSSYCDENSFFETTLKQAEQGNAKAQFSLGGEYYLGFNVLENHKEAFKWYTKSAEQGNVLAQGILGFMCQSGEGVTQNYNEAVKWYRKAAEQGFALSQCSLGVMYYNGNGVAQNFNKAVKWYRKAAEQGFALGQNSLALMYGNGQGVIEDYLEAYKWALLAGMNGHDVLEFKRLLRDEMTAGQIAEAHRLAKAFKPKVKKQGDDTQKQILTRESSIKASGTGFFIISNGYIVTAYHVVKDASKIQVLTYNGLLDAKIVRSMSAEDIAFLSVDGNNFSSLPVISSRGVKLGDEVFTIGFPNIGLQGFEPKFNKGSISSLAGMQDNPKHFQISVPIQSGNSGGALVDDKGNVVGIIVSKLSEEVTYQMTGNLPENVNYALKSSFVLSMLEASPEIRGQMLKPNNSKDNFSDIVERAKQSVALVLVY